MDNLSQQTNHTGEGDMNNFVDVSRMNPMWPYPHPVERFPQFRDFFHESTPPAVVPVNDTPHPPMQNHVTQVITNSTPQHPTVNSVPTMGTLQTVLTQGLNHNATVNHTPQPSHTQTHSVATPSLTPVQEQPTQVLTRMRLQDLVREVDPNEQLDEDVEDLLLQLADDFVESAITAACLLAKHRKSNTVEVKDLQLHLERNWNMWIPGFGRDELRPYKKSTVTEAHKQRLALIRKTLKKY